MCKIAIKKLELISGIKRVMFRSSGFVLFHGHNTPNEPIIKPNIKDCIVLLYFVKSNDIIFDNNTKPVTDPRVNMAIIFNLLIV